MNNQRMVISDLITCYQVFPPIKDRVLKDVIFVTVERRTDKSVDDGFKWIITDGIGGCYSVALHCWEDELPLDEWDDSTKSNYVYSDPIDAVRDALIAIEVEVSRYEEEMESDSLSENIKNIRRQIVARSRIHLAQIREILE